MNGSSCPFDVWTLSSWFPDDQIFFDERIDELVGVERNQVTDGFAEAYELHRQAELGLDREDDAAPGRAVELGEDDAGDSDPIRHCRVAELACLGQAVLARRRIDHNRAFVAALAGGARVLDLYCYGGAVAVTAAMRGAESVLGIDRSEPALTLAEASAQMNGVAERCIFRRGDVFAEAASLAGSGERFDIVVADPPPFARAKRDVPAALRGYRKLARLTAQVTAPGGFLFIASCSHNVGTTEFADAVRRGLTDAGRGGRILRQSGAGPDHPVHPSLPETGYLKTLTLALD